jgi:hypothetical protein
MGIRFPFLVVEAKGLASNGNLVSAQNQAAISGASMLAILRDLQAAAIANPIPTLEPGAATPASPSPVVPPDPSSRPAVCFSIVTEGPVHELWVHFEYQGALHMEYLKSWRTTQQRDAKGMAYLLARIMQWGRGDFKDCIVQRLDMVQRGRYQLTD